MSKTYPNTTEPVTDTDLSNAEAIDTALRIAAAYKNRADALLEILHDVQEQLGYVPQTVIPALAKELNLSRAEVFGVVSFYHDFRQQPAGSHVVKICQAEACQSMRGVELGKALEKHLKIKIGETTADGKITLEAVYCLGLCGVAPAMMVDKQLVGRASLDQLKNLLNSEIPS